MVHSAARTGNLPESVNESSHRRGGGVTEPMGMPRRRQWSKRPRSDPSRLLRGGERSVCSILDAWVSSTSANMNVGATPTRGFGTRQQSYRATRFTTTGSISGGE